jgi:hypothetical protein
MIVPKNFLYGFYAIVFFSIGLALHKEFETLFSFWLTVALISPPFLWAMSTTHTSLKCFTLIAFVTQFLTVPYFYLERDKWPFFDKAPFGFTAVEAFPILVKVSFYLLTVIFLTKLISVLTGSNRSSHQKKNPLDYNYPKKRWIDFSKAHMDEFEHRSKRRKFTFIIISIFPILILFNLWTFDMGIAITGVEAPRLPLKLSGIIFYFKSYLVPIVLGYLYYNATRRWPLMFLYLIYSLVFGLSSVSKLAVLLVMTPVIVLAWIERRQFFCLIAAIGTFVGVFVASQARNYVHYVEQGVTGADTSQGLFAILMSIISEPDSMLLKLDFIPWMIAGIAGRVEAFGNLVQAHYYNPDAVIGPVGSALRMIWVGLVEINVDAHHVEWLGYTLPKGFYSGGSILSNAIIMSKSGLWWLVLSALITAVVIVIIDTTITKFCNKIQFFRPFRVPAIFYFTMSYFTHSTMDVVFVTCITVMFLIPKVFYRKIKISIRTT